MSLRTLVPLLVSALLLLLGSTPPPTFSQDRTTSGTASLDAEGTVVVDNHEGRITVETWDRAKVKYEAVVRPESDAEHPEATVVRVDSSDRRFTLRTEYDESKGTGDDGDSDLFGDDDNENLMPVDYTLTVPRGAHLEVEDHESEIQVTGLAGPATIDTHDGSIRLTDQDAEAEIESHDGPIRVENQTGALTIDTHDSDMRLRFVDGDVEIESHGGDVEAEELRGGLTVETHDGDGRFAFAELTGDVDVTTHDGSFTFTLPTGTGFDLRTDFDDDDARLRADFDLLPYRIGGEDEHDEVNYAGSVNGGGPRISLSAHDGDFEIRLR